ncbi:RNA polymerase sigma factor [Desulfamplus magnetovallimortis]|uniref:RNA polymerase sigma factor n=1 Tax=Desulfamplus magnetovallimortis TaxID=1246637 RepID=UPI001FE2FE41|nr:sigma-70 family RNA polymerase sigma factor [Desulfamplus magnetovallimortis]
MTTLHVKLDEKQLLQELKKGNRLAFEHLVKRYQHRLLSIACGITLDREESLEIVQDVFMRVHQNIHTFRGESSLMSWMRIITVNLSLNWKRKWLRRFRWKHHDIETEDGGILPDAENSGEHETPEAKYIDRQLEQKIMKNIALMPEKMRTVFVLKTVEHLSYEEIAQTLNIKTGTVRSRLHNARQLLAESLNE